MNKNGLLARFYSHSLVTSFGVPTAKTEPATTKIIAINTRPCGTIPLMINAAKGVRTGLMKKTNDAAIADDFSIARK